VARPPGTRGCAIGSVCWHGACLRVQKQSVGDRRRCWAPVRPVGPCLPRPLNQAETTTADQPNQRPRRQTQELRSGLQSVSREPTLVVSLPAKHLVAAPSPYLLILSDMLFGSPRARPHSLLCLPRPRSNPPSRCHECSKPSVRVALDFWSSSVASDYRAHRHQQCAAEPDPRPSQLQKVQ